MVKFRDQLREQLKGKIPDELIPLLPTGFQAISFVAIVNLKEELYEYRMIIGETLLKLLRSVKSVWIRKGIIKGQFREPSGLEFIVGDPTTEIEHHENNLRYRFDFTKIMFAKGNVSERKYLPSLVRDGEIIIDMFAGIGYFSLGIGKFAKPEHVYSIELNPNSFKYLKKNVEINKISSRVTPINGDCAEVVTNLAEKGIKADRVVMGVFPAPYKYLDAAAKVIKEVPLKISTDIDKFIEMAETKYKYDIYESLPGSIENTIVHFEGVVMGKDINDMFTKVSETLSPLGFKTSLLAFRFVKSFGPKMWHLVLDILVGT